MTTKYTFKITGMDFMTAQASFLLSLTLNEFEDFDPEQIQTNSQDSTIWYEGDDYRWDFGVFSEILYCYACTLTSEEMRDSLGVAFESYTIQAKCIQNDTVIENFVLEYKEGIITVNRSGEKGDIHGKYALEDGYIEDEDFYDLFS